MTEATGAVAGRSGPAATETLIGFNEICKQFGSTVVLDNLTFDVGHGERVTLIGPSGSGKTTILRLLMTLVRPTSGTITVGDEYLFHEQHAGGLVPAGEAHIRRVRSQITMVFQHFNLFPNMRVLRNVTEAPIHVLGKSKDEAEASATELLEMVGLGDKIHSYPSQLSGGQQQRVAIARALAVDPNVLLLDEVTSALDPEIAAEVLDVLRDIARSTDVTMLFVTHAMRFARDVSNRVMMFSDGSVVEEGPPERIFNEPEHERTRQFLHSVLAES